MPRHQVAVSVLVSVAASSAAERTSSVHLDGRPVVRSTMFPSRDSADQRHLPSTQVAVDAGPNAACVQLGPSTPALNSAVAGILAILTCRVVSAPPAAPVAPVRAALARAAPAIDPGELAVQFWQTIPLPGPHPSIPPNYAVTGMPAYLVTNGTLAPSPYQRQTPLGPLYITARGSYLVDWGDSTVPAWAGPYKYEGRPYPDGNISHTYDNVGTVTVTVQEVWTASLATRRRQRTTYGPENDGCPPQLHDQTDRVHPHRVTALATVAPATGESGQSGLISSPTASWSATRSPQERPAISSPDRGLRSHPLRTL